MHSVQVKRAVLVVALLGGILPASAFAWGGRYPTGDVYGSTIQINVSDAYPVDPALTQDWATFFGSLVHGRELASLTVDLAPLDEVQQFCGPQALACYDPGSQTIEASPEDQLNAPAAKEIVTHEYGHHVANNSLNTPFDAEAYGTKRWASYMNICKRAVAGELFPGDEGDNYEENPGEAYAEAYRVLNLTKQGATSIGWDIVDPMLYPNATALSTLEQDITTPWKGPTCPTCTARSATAPRGRSSPRPRSTDRSSPACTPRRSRACDFSSSPRDASSQAAAACATRSAASAH